MKPQRLHNGNLLIPVAVETDDVIGDVLIEVTPEDPQYKEWLPFLDTERELQAPDSESSEQHAHRL
jgi:hypothetical protein